MGISVARGAFYINVVQFLFQMSYVTRLSIEPLLLDLVDVSLFCDLVNNSQPIKSIRIADPTCGGNKLTHDTLCDSHVINYRILHLLCLWSSHMMNALGSTRLPMLKVC